MTSARLSDEPLELEGKVERKVERLARRTRELLLESTAVYWSLTVVLAACLAIPVVLRYPVNHDLGALLDLVHRVLHGERLYSQIVEPNPPLILGIYFPAVAFARLTGIPAIDLLDPWLVLVLFWCGGLAYRVSRDVEVPGALATRRLLLWLFLYASTLDAGYDFGQRDHLVFVLTFPYLLAAAGRARGKPLSMPLAAAAGLTAAVGFALKPHFVVLWILVEGYLAAKKGIGAFRRLENVLVVTCVGVYGLWLALGTSYLASLRVIRFSYSAYEASFGDLAAASRPAVWALALVLLVAIREPDGDRDLHVLLGLAVGAHLVSGFAQMKGWDYHFVPLRAVAHIATGVALLGLARSGGALRRVLRVPPAAITAGAALVLLFLSGRWAYGLKESPEWNLGPTVRRLAYVFSKLAPGGKAALVTNSCFPMFPAASYADVHNVLRLGTWPIPTFYQGVRAGDGPFPYHPMDRLSPLERRVFDQMAEDLERARPELIVFDRQKVRQAFGDSTFQYEDYFSRDPRLRAILARYQPVVDAGGFRFYKLRG